MGSIPFSYIMAKLVAKVDLRQVGTGTVSGTGLYRVTGFFSLGAAGILEVGKGVGAVFLAGDPWPSDAPLLSALSVGCVTAGHNWSIWLKGSGGRGLSPAMGALAFVAWPAAVFLGLIFAIGRLVKKSGIAVFWALLIMPFIAWAAYGRYALLAAALASFLILTKRLMGNPGKNSDSSVRTRLLYDTTQNNPSHD